MKHVQVLSKNYVIDTAKKTVTCVVKFKLNLRVSFGNSCFACDTPLKDGRIKELMKSYSRAKYNENPVFFIAKTAECKGDDKFNVETGIDVSRHKVELKLLSINERICMMLQNDFKKAQHVEAIEIGNEMQRRHDLLEEIRKY